MNGKEIVSKLDFILQWIFRLVVLNVAWIFFSVLGLFVAGIFPSTAAMLSVARKWILGEHDIKIFQTFKKIYRQEFATANILGWILTITGVILYVNFQLMKNSVSVFSIVTPFAFYLMVFFYMILLIWAFPMLVHYKATWRQHLKNAIIVGLSKIHYTLMCGLAIFLVLYLSLSYPGIIPFFTISVLGIGVMWVTLRVFTKMDQRVTMKST
ncbi:YesL family protein [Metabacillus endolithicus]|uniref:YesL family protein n=1 Tax=Metabacillus endolithicus TaxID=1535204 RepID=A0ABW5C5E2_9BACI|nr:YesL family protein [Metabacillus endolithicus]UPG61905.1 YesL family protein [Metabacillus endolithicus]